ncbi:hypothetical protein OSTOST_25988, partial [Ostertagia ostertagi]
MEVVNWDEFYFSASHTDTLSMFSPSYRTMAPDGYRTNVDISGALKRFFIDKIRASGPITVAEYMKTAISAPTVGYYGGFSDSQKVFGEEGDFITAPELTQLFGELLGVWCYYELANTGHAGMISTTNPMEVVKITAEVVVLDSGPWQLVECGPGTGQLMHDILLAMDKFQEKNLSVHLVETSDALIRQQEEVLCGSSSSSTSTSSCGNAVRKNKSNMGVPIFWYKTLDDVPEQFSVFVANEFLDALPVHQFCRESDGVWHEVYINIDKAGELCFMRSKGENLHTRGLIPEDIRAEKETSWSVVRGVVYGTNYQKDVILIIHDGGFGLIIDYGHDGSRNDLSLQRPIRREQSLAMIDGRCQFALLKSLHMLIVHRLEDEYERDFLAQLGAQVRLRNLLKSCSDREKQEALISKSNHCINHITSLWVIWANDSWLCLYFQKRSVEFLKKGEDLQDLRRIDPRRRKTLKKPIKTMVKTKDHGLQAFQSIRMKWEISTQSCILNLLGDGALPSPVVLFCCLDRKCFECYAVLAILAEYGSMGNLKKEDYMALGSYMGLEPVGESDEDDQSFVGTEIEETETGDTASKSLRNSHVCDYLGKLAQTWKIALPQMEQKSSPSLRLLRTLMRYVCAPGYVVKSKHGDKCASCRCNYEPLYQEFGVFLYPENRGELGSPPLFYGKLSDGTAVARTFQLYLYTPD